MTSSQFANQNYYTDAMIACFAFPELARAVGLEEIEASIDNKLSQGPFAAAFFLVRPGRHWLRGRTLWENLSGFVADKIGWCVASRLFDVHTLHQKVDTEQRRYDHVPKSEREDRSAYRFYPPKIRGERSARRLGARTCASTAARNSANEITAR